MFKNLVVAVDGSHCAGHALEVASDLAKMTGAKLAICCVADPSPVYGALEPTVLIERTLEEIRSEARRVVDRALAKAQAGGAIAEGFTPEGEPVYEIIGYAHTIKADGIAIGTHGRSGIRRFFMGSIAEGVMREATVPVITVREEARVPGIPAEEPSVKILVPVDGSETSQRALGVAVDFAQTVRGEIILCHVVNLAEVAMLSGGQAQLLQECLEECQSRGKTILDEAVARVGDRVAVATRSADGEPVEEIARLAEEIRPDFIVIGSHGRSGIGRAVLGSVAEGVMRVAPAPVIVVPAKRAHAA